MADSLIVPLVCTQCGSNQLKLDSERFREVFTVEGRFAYLKAGETYICEYCDTKFVHGKGYARAPAAQVKINTGGSPIVFGDITAGRDVNLGAGPVRQVDDEVGGVGFVLSGDFRGAQLNIHGKIECPQCGQEVSVGLTCSACGANLPRRQ